MIRRFLATTMVLALAASTATAQPAVQAVTVVATRGGIGTGGGGFVGTGNIGTLGVFQFLCTDFPNSIALPASYSAWVTPLWNNTDMSKTRLGAGSLATYLANANLGSQIGTGSNTPTDGMLQDRMWAKALSSVGNPSSTYLMQNFDPTGWYVVTEPIAVGKPFGGKQELLAYRANVVPEPATLALTAFGLLGLAYVARRRRTLARARTR